MSERDGYPQGVPCWADIAVGDVEAAQAFYGGLFGWEWDVNTEFNYATATLRGKRVAAVSGQMSPDQPTVWVTYLAVDDADKFAAGVTEHGGQLIAPAMDVPGQGRLALAVDPTGAFFGVWQAQQHRGSQIVNEPGSVVWSELVTPDLDAAAAFYIAVLGVDWTDMDTGGNGPYKLLQVDGRTVGGAMPMSAGTDQLPPHWGVYFEVADAGAAVARVRELGGQVLVDVQPTPQGPMAVFTDPQGGVFSVIASGSTE